LEGACLFLCGASKTLARLREVSICGMLLESSWGSRPSTTVFHSRSVPGSRVCLGYIGVALRNQGSVAGSDHPVVSNVPCWNDWPFPSSLGRILGQARLRSLPPPRKPGTPKIRFGPWLPELEKAQPLSPANSIQVIASWRRVGANREALVTSPGQRQEGPFAVPVPV